jgi:ribonuclease HI
MVKREEKTAEDLKVDPIIARVDSKLVKNKIQRISIREKQNALKRQQKSLKRKTNKEDPEHVPQPVLLQEDKREKDDTMVKEEELEEIKEEEGCDEFQEYYKDQKPPKILVFFFLV